jgi:GAF domain-containing protein
LIEERSRKLDEHAIQLQTASELAREAAALKDLVTLTDQCVRLIQEKFNFYHVGIYLVDDERRFIVLKAVAGLAGSLELKSAMKIRLGEVNIISNAVVSGEPRIINNVDVDYIFRRNPLLPDTRAEAVFPLKAGSEVIGVLDIHSIILNAFGEDEVVILQILADELAIAIQNARLVQSLQQSSVEANALYQRYTQAVWSREALGKRVGGYEYNLLEVKPIEIGEGFQYELPGEVLKRLRSGKATLVKKTLLVPAQELQVEATSSEHPVLLVPLLMYNQLIGIVGLEDDQPGHTWTDDEIAVVEAVASQIALSLDNARLLEESQIRSSQLRLLQEVTAVAASHTNLLELLDNVSQKLRASFNLLHCGMFLIEPDGQSLSLVANASAEPFMPGAKLIGSKIPLEGNSLIEPVFHERSSRVIYDVQKIASEDAPYSLGAMQEFIQIRGAETIVFMPLLSRGEVVGVASLEFAGESSRFSEADLQLIDQISLQISSAFDVARSFEQATLRAERERRVGEITSRIRETLDIHTILKTAAQEVRQALGVPEVTVRLTSEAEGGGGVKQPLEK